MAKKKSKRASVAGTKTNGSEETLKQQQLQPSHPTLEEKPSNKERLPLVGFENFAKVNSEQSKQLAKANDVLAKFMQYKIKPDNISDLSGIIGQLKNALNDAQELLDNQDTQNSIDGGSVSSRSSTSLDSSSSGSISDEEFAKEAQSCLKRLYLYTESMPENIVTLSKSLPPIVVVILNNLRPLTTTALGFKSLMDYMKDGPYDKDGAYNLKGMFNLLGAAGLQLTTLYDLFRFHKASSAIKPEDITPTNIAIFLVVTYILSLVVQFAVKYMEKKQETGIEPKLDLIDSINRNKKTLI